MWPEEDREKEEEPEWVTTEKQQFRDYRDKNKDGKMDKEEVAAWILPPDYDHIDSEAKHLISESDTNNVRTHFPLDNCTFKIIFMYFFVAFSYGVNVNKLFL